MDVILYIDLFFLWNFWMNILVLFLVRQLTKTYRTIQCLFAAVLGAMVSSGGLIWIINNHNFLSILFFEGLVIIIMNLLAFGRKNLLWHLLLFLISGTVVAGSFYYLVSFPGIGKNEVALGMVSGACLIFCTVLEKKSRLRWKEEHMKAKTVLEFGDRKLFATALMDTGNKLYDPFFHKPVILIDETMLGDMLEQCKNKYPEKYHFIPFHSVGKENGLLEGITFDCVSVQWQNKRLKFNNVIAASTKGSLYKGKEYQVIFHCGLLQDV